MKLRSCALPFGLLAALFFAVLPMDGHHAVLRFNLEEMVVVADRIFVGTCVKVEPTTDMIGQGELPVTRYTFKVERVLKGDVPKEFTFTQLGHPRTLGKGVPTVGGSAATLGMFLHGMEAYNVGERFLLLLVPYYQNGKLTYPVGLAQGAFLVEEEEEGGLTARNELNNLGLFDAPYNGLGVKPGLAKLIRPEASTPIASDAPVSSEARSLQGKRGAFPLEPLLELISKIHAAHSEGSLKTSGGQS